MAGKKKLTDKQKKARAKAASKKFTVGKALDLYAFGGTAVTQGLIAYQTGDVSRLTTNLPLHYSGLDITDGTVHPAELIKGYGGSINRIAEKKLFKMVGVKAPRSQIKTVGDALDYLTYFGNTGFAVWGNRFNPGAASVAAYKAQFGVDLGAAGTDAYQPMEMITKKWAPYILQKKIRKLLNIKGFPIG